MRKNTILMAVLQFILFYAYSPQTSAQQSKAEQVRALFDHLYANGMFNGGVGIKEDGATVFRQGYGKADFRRDTEFTPSSMTEIASVSKQFTATAILLLRDEGKLELDDDMNTHLPHALPYEGVTIRHLLSHQSGLPDYQSYFTRNWTLPRLVSNKDIMNYLREKKPKQLAAPGAEYRYSNLGYIVLAEIVEHVSSKPLDLFLETRIFQPFGLHNTGFVAREKYFTLPTFAPGFIWDDESQLYRLPEELGKKHMWSLSGRLGPGRMSSTVDDLLQWDSLLYTGKLVSLSTLQEMFSPAVQIDDDFSYGLGWRTVNNDLSTVYHTGSWSGNYTYIKRYTASRSTIVILNNTYSPHMAKIRKAVDDIMEGKGVTYLKVE